MFIQSMLPFFRYLKLKFFKSIGYVAIGLDEPSALQYKLVRFKATCIPGDLKYVKIPVSIIAPANILVPVNFVVPGSDAYRYCVYVGPGSSNSDNDRVEVTERDYDRVRKAVRS